MSLQKNEARMIGVFRSLSMDDSARIEEKLRSIEVGGRQRELGAEMVQFRWQKCTTKSLDALDEEYTVNGSASALSAAE